MLALPTYCLCTCYFSYCNNRWSTDVRDHYLYEQSLSWNCTHASKPFTIHTSPSSTHTVPKEHPSTTTLVPTWVQIKLKAYCGNCQRLEACQFFLVFFDELFIPQPLTTGYSWFSLKMVRKVVIIKISDSKSSTSAVAESISTCCFFYSPTIPKIKMVVNKISAYFLKWEKKENICMRLPQTPVMYVSYNTILSL